jgi:hypothetical protein
MPICFPICYPTVDKINISKISASNLQQNTLTQINDQLGSARTTWGSPTVANTSTQTAGSSQLGSATNNLNVTSSALRSLITVKQVDATNLQSNTTVQANTQKGYTVTGGWLDPIYNTSTQSAWNSQIGSATNNINIWA